MAAPSCANLVVARRSERRVLEAVERALAGEWGAVPASRPKLAGEGRKHRVVAQLIVVGQVLVAQCDAQHPLRDHALDRVLDLPLAAAAIETGREPAPKPSP